MTCQTLLTRYPLKLFFISLDSWNNTFIWFRHCSQHLHMDGHFKNTSIIKKYLNFFKKNQNGQLKMYYKIWKNNVSVFLRVIILGRLIYKNIQILIIVLGSIYGSVLVSYIFYISCVAMFVSVLCLVSM